MINRENLLALRNAIDAILEGEMPVGKPSRTRLTADEKFMELHRNNYAAGTWKLPKAMREKKSAASTKNSKN